MSRGTPYVPVFVFDGACGFCRRWVERWQKRTGPRVLMLPFQTPGVLRALGIHRRDAARASWFVEPDGRRSVGADAVFRLLRQGEGTRLAARLGLLPGVRWVAGRVYRFIAGHRVAAARVDRLLFGDRRARPGTRYVRWVFLRLLGLTFLAAFVSLDRQVLGLFGSRGIQPVEPLLQSARDWPLRRRALSVPTVFWADASDAALVRACRWGETLSLAIVLNLAPRWSLLGATGLYLSFVSVGSPFLSFQWDALLIESGFQSALVAPGGLLPRAGRRPGWASTFLMRWLAFRLHFESGIAKWLSGDETWRKRTACCHYYETAPLPTRLGWRAHHLPARVNRASTTAALALEIAVPWLAFGTRRMRRWCFGALTTLQATIAATGNYGFFNLLSGALCVWLLDDEDLLPARARTDRTRRESGWHRALVVAGALPVLAVSGARLVDRFRERPLSPRLRRLAAHMAPFELVNPYGLFSVMTTERPEIVVEGSDDGERWEPIPFRYKPGDPSQAPGLVAPHMPRLDWQLWFAALEGAPPSWFLQFLVRLLQGSPEVWSLLERNPFGDRPPRWVRARLYDYRMTRGDERRRTGVWWHRRLLGEFVPPIGLAQEAGREVRGP